jgi:wobble nucleotide-excising tRNase
MIKKIVKLKDFGLFKNFAWNSLDEFKKKNLIYGWNYSGKTTLSKLFQNLEFKDTDKYFKDAEFKIEVDNRDAQSFDEQSDFITFPFAVKVFNSEYIRRIFSWENQDKEGIEPIAFYLGDPAGNIKTEIEELEEKISGLNEIKKNRYNPLITKFTDYSKQNGKFTLKAKDIRENYLPKLFAPHEFNKSDFEQRVNRVKQNIDDHVITDEKKKTQVQKEALAQKEFESQNEEISVVENLSNLNDELKKVLEKEALEAKDFVDLKDDNDLFQWVQKGLELHKGERNCKFCTKEIPSNRISDLNAFYSEKLKEIQADIKSLRDKIKNEIKGIEINVPVKEKLGKQYRDKYSTAIANYNEVKKHYSVQLSILDKDLDKKEGNYFNSIEATGIEIVSLSEKITEIQNVIQEHNEWITQFETRKATAIDNILNHFISEYLKEEGYLDIEKENKKAETIIGRIEKLVEKYDNRILELRKQLSDKVRGQEELNDSLEILLHRDDIKIEIRNEKFTLERSGFPATSLSEGEKSAIAFSYFLTELKSLSEAGTLKDTIVFFDDPISSLDSNHIFQVRSLIQDFFKQKEFRQLFVSTHNFEFFSVMLDTKLFGRIENNTGEHNRPLYYIKRFDDNTATIVKLPKTFSSYKSEYISIFHTLKEFHEFGIKEDYPNLIILPNALRRFLELYTLMKYPCDQEVDNRVKVVFCPEDKPYHNTKLLHWFSHQNRFEKIQQHDDKILQLDDAIKDLMTHIENEDPMHWKGLIGN